MEKQLDAKELKKLVQSVFSLTEGDHHLLFIVDVPDNRLPDTELWLTRRTLAEEWCRELSTIKKELHFETVRLLAYPNVHSNNADLPSWGVFMDSGMPQATTETISKMKDRVIFNDILAEVQIVMAPTQLSTTAPLKLLAPQLDFRAATMPGFSPAMLPALRLDYAEVNRRVDLITTEVSVATAADIQFTVDSKDVYNVHFDLRHREGHASGGRFPRMGEAGNFPSGESYIVPYEGELNDASESQGTIPVQLGDEVVIYRIEKNKAVKIISTGPQSEKEKSKITEEPAYSNIAELGFGVLNDFGLSPVGVTLLDEKLGLHIAFGRSDHFGGNVGVKDFSSPEAVVHIDRIYIPETAPRIFVNRVELTYPDRSKKLLMKNGEYTIF